MGEAAELVVVVLERVAVDGSEPDPQPLGVLTQCGVVVDPVPRDVERDRRGEPGVAVHLGRIRDLLLDGAGRAGAAEHLEPRTGVAVGPRGNLDRLPLEERGDLVEAGHRVPSSSVSGTPWATAESWSSRWKISSRTRKPSSGARPSRSSKNSDISACQRALTSVRAMPACASAIDGVST